MKKSSFCKPRLMLLVVMFWLLACPLILAAGTDGIPQREDIEDKYKWQVEDMYEDISVWEADFKLLESGLVGYEKYEGHLGDSPEMLLNCLKLSDSLGVIDGNLYVYAYLKLDEDNRRSEYQELGGRISALDARFEEAGAFIEPELLTLDLGKIESFMKEKPELEVYRFYFENMMRQKEHILSSEEEGIIAQAAPLIQTPLKVFNMIDNADHKLGTVVDSSGKKIELTYGRYLRILKGTDREMRRIANDTVQQSWLRYINTLAATFGSSLEKDLFLTKVREYNSTLERTLDDDNIPQEVYNNLIETVNANLAPLHKWISLRKKVLGYDTLFTYDLSVSLVPEFEKKYSYQETKKMVLKGLKPLGKQYLKDFEMGLNSGWVDVFENEGKGSGAYQWGTYTSHPYVLMNFDSTLSSLFTLAHEMGHALNSYYSNQKEPYLYHNHSTFTAEVASTCNEAILMKYLLTNAESKEEKLVLLEHYIRQIDGTFFTQVMFSEFEQAVHEHLQNGGATSVDYFRKTYRDIFQKYYGPDLTVGINNDMSGMKIYHFYRTFYVYQYATSYAAAQMLSQKILEGDKKALEAYMTFLATGSSKYPVDILKDAGVDVTGPEPVERTIRLFGELVDEMERFLEAK